MTIRLGKRQREILSRMRNENLVIRVITDHYKPNTDIELQDEEGDNTFLSITHKMMQSLCDKKIFDSSGWCPCLQITIDTFRLKKSFTP